MFGGEQPEGGFHFARQARVHRGSYHSGGGAIFERLFTPDALSAGTQTIDGAAARYGRQPGNGGAAAAVEGGGCPPDLDVGVQGDLLGIGGVAEDARDQSVDQMAGSIVEFGKGGLIGCGDAVDEAAPRVFGDRGVKGPLVEGPPCQVAREASIANAQENVRRRCRVAKFFACAPLDVGASEA